MKRYCMQKNAPVAGVICATMIIAVTFLFVIPTDVSAAEGKPIAVIEGTLNVKQGQTVSLDGSESSDPGDAPLDYQWTLLSAPEGSQAILDDSSESEASFEADAVGKYRVKLVVNNGLTDSDPVYVEITVTEGQ
jgi:hypothetical protein